MLPMFHHYTLVDLKRLGYLLLNIITISSGLFLLLFNTSISVIDLLASFFVISLVPVNSYHILLAETYSSDDNLGLIDLLSDW